MTTAMNMAIACTVTISREETALTSADPIPGNANTASTATMPPSRKFIDAATTCKLGAKMLGKA